MNNRLSQNQINVLVAYRNQTSHTEGTRTVNSLLDRGLLEPTPGLPVFEAQLQISDAGRKAIAGIQEPNPMPNQIEYINVESGRFYVVVNIARKWRNNTYVLCGARREHALDLITAASNAGYKVVGSKAAGLRMRNPNYQTEAVLERI